MAFISPRSVATYLPLTPFNSRKLSPFNSLYLQKKVRFEIIEITGISPDSLTLSSSLMTAIRQAVIVNVNVNVQIKIV